MTQRRQFLAVVVVAGVPPMLARAQPQKKLPVIGMLHSGPTPSPEAVAKHPLIVRLRELGWEEGKTVLFEPGYAAGREDRLPALAAALVTKKVDLIFRSGTNPALAARQATDTIPIIARGPDLLALGLVSSLARPGGNLTGLPNEAGQGVLAKRLELLKRAAPTIKRVVYLRNRRPGTFSAEVTAAARALGLELSAAEADSPEDLDALFAVFARRRPDALWCAGSESNFRLRRRIIEYAARERLPAIYTGREFAESGGLMSYAVNPVAMSRRAAEYIDRVLRGAKPGDLPVEMPTRFELVINLKTAKAQGLKIPQDLLLLADEVIQ